MADKYYPISALPFLTAQPNSYIKFYAAGTSNPIKVAMNIQGTDEQGRELLLSHVYVNSKRMMVNPSGGTMNAHISEIFKAVGYRNEFDCVNNIFASALWVVDDVAFGLLALGEDDSQIDANTISYRADLTAIIRTVYSRLNEFITVKDFGTSANGTDEDSNAISTAMATGIRCIIVTSGTYLCNGFNIGPANNNQSVFFMGDVVLKAASNNAIMFKQSASGSKHYGGFRVDSNGKTGVKGMYVTPASLDDQSLISNQQFNDMPRITGDAGVEDLVVLQCGPDVVGTDSLNRYNRFPSIDGNGSRRIVWLKSASNEQADIPRYNTFESITGGSESNTGVQIDAGAENTFVMTALDGLVNGTQPNSNPTGLKHPAACAVTSKANNGNKFLAGYIQNCTRNLDVANEFIDYRLAIAGSNAISKFIRRHGIGYNLSRLYIGAVSAGGLSSFLPNGWSVTKTGTGAYRVTHNLNTTAYAVVPGVNDGNSVIGFPSKLANSFDVEIAVHNSSDRQDRPFTFFLGLAA